MADTTVTIRVDEEIKRRFEEFCADVGMNMSVAVNMFIRASLKEQKIPFPIESAKALKLKTGKRSSFPDFAINTAEFIFDREKANER